VVDVMVAENVIHGIEEADELVLTSCGRRRSKTGDPKILMKLKMRAASRSRS